MQRYDADQAPDPEAWLALEPDERSSLVLRHHRGRVERIHDEGYNRKVHAHLHVAVENQVAEGQSATVRTLERVTEQGVRRHVAVHMIIEALIQQIAAGVDFDDGVWATRLDALQPGDWLGARMQRDLNR